MLALDLIRRWGPWALLGLAVLMLVLAGPAACKRAARLAAEKRIATEQQQSSSANARDAIVTTGASAERERHSTDLTIRNEREIRNAQGADQPVDSSVTGAGLDGLCRRAAYRDGERCRLRRAPAR